MVDKQARKSKHGTILFEPVIVYLHPATPTPSIHHCHIATRSNHSYMSAQQPSLFQVARSKLQLSHGTTSSRDKCSLHRWVLLKNSLIHSQPSSPAPPCSQADVNSVYATEEDEEDDMVCADEEHDSFMFPDAGMLVDPSPPRDTPESESQWFDSLLESLGDEDVEDYANSPDDDEPPFTPPVSPMSSSDDLIGHHPVYNDPPIAMPYPIVYPPYHSSLIRPLEFDSLNCSYPPLDLALPYYESEDVDDMPVPDAIEDLSDDESDSLSTPSHSRSIPMYQDAILRPRQGRDEPQVYVDTDDAYFYPFELDPLPFPEDHRTSPHAFNHVYHQEC
ncbi:uncharacterized protein STEHIDRAFT_75173 [Stereum hirsutum FP-91666 SS1]|uniref:uncharacterized protein n=1 Tax=Stereum hirsutum (strain FP-91666) TaxID=721885 RepID=UPI000440B5FE|nr:uncharacterized protein STEHIDRAFT_75173 [Stereum hirsutum FP-91666 SS1]EIM90415.1 hypothetical protein STEHIDRAFT_75173 [Stereum hirsutum FP-91666 SS1]